MDAQIPILAIGNLSASEFQGAADWLAHRGATTVPDTSAALGAMNEGFAPAMIILSQRWRGELSSRHVEALRRAAPLALIVSLLGPWLEGETRTGRPIAGAVRVYWHQWTEFARKLEAGPENHWSGWSLPQTASEDERLLSAHESAPPESAPRGMPTLLVGIISQGRETFQSLAGVCAHHGWQSVWLRNIEARSVHPDVILCDSANNSRVEFSRLGQLIAAYDRCPTIVLSGFPRVDEVSGWTAAGAAAVIAKPFRAHELAALVERLVSQPASIQ